MQTLACTGQSEARGRNRWCHLAVVERTIFTHGHADEARRLSHPCCPQCQETQHLADATPWVEGTLVVQEATCPTCGACWHDVSTSRSSVLHDA